MPALYRRLLCWLLSGNCRDCRSNRGRRLHEPKHYPDRRRDIVLEASRHGSDTWQRLRRRHQRRGPSDSRLACCFLETEANAGRVAPPASVPVRERVDEHQKVLAAYPWMPPPPSKLPARQPRPSRRRVLRGPTRGQGDLRRAVPHDGEHLYRLRTGRQPAVDGGGLQLPLGYEPDRYFPSLTAFSPQVSTTHSAEYVYFFQFLRHVHCVHRHEQSQLFFRCFALEGCVKDECPR
ncbi:hypothetical protein LY78DRAFT_103495 [Colletotrichum sublineola]|nr:hypothetical protein LY78DRAFT_103495 [Colletotrichum sublineola]